MSAGAAVRLTPLTEDDRAVLFAWINDRELVEMSSAFKPVSLEDHNRWFDGIRRRPDTTIFAIRREGESRLIGTCQLLNIDAAARTAELQIRIGDAASRGIGLGTAAVRQLVDYGFRELELHRISLHVFETNIAAQRAYEKSGFSVVGRIAAAATIGGKPVNALVMAVSK